MAASPPVDRATTIKSITIASCSMVSQTLELTIYLEARISAVVAGPAGSILSVRDRITCVYGLANNTAETPPPTTTTPLPLHLALWCPKFLNSPPTLRPKSPPWWLVPKTPPSNMPRPDPSSLSVIKFLASTTSPTTQLRHGRLRLRSPWHGPQL